MTTKISAESNASKPAPCCWVGLERLDGTFWLDQHDLTGDAANKMRKLKSWHHQKTGLCHRILAYLLCRRWIVAIGAVNLSQSLPAIESQAFHETQFESLARHDALTRAFYRPESLLRNSDFFDRLPNFTSCNVLVVSHELSRSRLLAFVLIVGIVGLAICIGVGAEAKDAQLGSWITAGVFGMLAVVQAAV